MKIKGYKCVHCGSGDFSKEPENRMRCSYCKSLYVVQKKETKSSGVFIRRGAKVRFAKDSHTTVKGQLYIEDGADVQFLGKITVLEKASDEAIRQAKEALRK